jgi:hypothetical protein
MLYALGSIGVVTLALGIHAWRQWRTIQDLEEIVSIIFTRLLDEGIIVVKNKDIAEFDGQWEDT